MTSNINMLSWYMVITCSFQVINRYWQHFFLLHIRLNFPLQPLSWEVWCLPLLLQKSLQFASQYSSNCALINYISVNDQTLLRTQNTSSTSAAVPKQKENKLHSIHRIKKQNILFTAIIKYSDSLPFTGDRFFLPATTSSAVNVYSG